MKITWHGHAFIEIQVDEKQILIDPFITGNPFLLQLSHLIF